VSCYISYSEEGTGRGRSPPRLLLAVPNVTVTAHPSTASVPITVFLYNGPLLCGFNVPTKGLHWKLMSHVHVICTAVRLNLFHVFFRCCGLMSLRQLNDDDDDQSTFLLDSCFYVCPDLLYSGQTYALQSIELR